MAASNTQVSLPPYADVSVHPSNPAYSHLDSSFPRDQPCLEPPPHFGGRNYNPGQPTHDNRPLQDTHHQSLNSKSEEISSNKKSSLAQSRRSTRACRSAGDSSFPDPSSRVSASTTSQGLWNHASDEEHLHALCAQGSYPYKLDRKEGLPDNLGRLSHYLQQKCTVNGLLDYDCTSSGCLDPIDNSPSTRMAHYLKCHAPGAYNRDEVMFIDAICEFGFASRNLLQGYLWGGVRLRGFQISRVCSRQRERQGF